MFLTQDNYRQIQEWLLTNAKKDTDYDFSSNLNGGEIITFVQNGKNVKSNVKDFLQQLQVLMQSDNVVNITAKYDKKYIDLEEAILTVPAEKRELGSIITFLNPKKIWNSYQFMGENVSQWRDLNLWEKVFANGVSITSVEQTTKSEDSEGNNVITIKFSDNTETSFTIKNGRNLKYSDLTDAEKDDIRQPLFDDIEEVIDHILGT